MTSEDPFFLVKEEVSKSLDKSKELYGRWRELTDFPQRASGADELTFVTNELKNCLRSIDWDIEDLDETIEIVEKNPQKFRLSTQEMQNRRAFVSMARDATARVKTQLANPGATMPTNGGDMLKSTASSARYMRLENELNRENQAVIDTAQQQQQHVMREQDSTLELIGGSARTLKAMSRRIGDELDEQDVLLDDLHRGVDETESRLDAVSKKLAKVLHMSTDRRQWIAIAILVVTLIIVIIIFFS